MVAKKGNKINLPKRFSANFHVPNRKDPLGNHQSNNSNMSEDTTIDVQRTIIELESQSETTDSNFIDYCTDLNVITVSDEINNKQSEKRASMTH